MHLQCAMSFIFDWEGRRLGMRDTLKHGTIKVSGFGYFHKNCVFRGKKIFQRQIQEVHYTIPIRHITNISDFVWFQRSYGSMKSVSSFSSIDVRTPCHNVARGLVERSVQQFCGNCLFKVLYIRAISASAPFETESMRLPCICTESLHSFAKI